MRRERGLQIHSVYPGGLAESAGLRPGDFILALNGKRLRDSIDFLFYGSDADLRLDVEREGKRMSLHVRRAEGQEFGAEFKPFKITTCRNNCIFCFVKQLPKGLRKTLYVKDEDYRMSFLYGNYVTLTNLSRADRQRIVEQRLMPLFVSVHATNRSIRNEMLGNPKAPDVMKELQFLSENKIRFHAQIVLCPGYNDGSHLRRTLNDLYHFYPYLLSVAVVPVGLTAHRRFPLKPVEKNEAIESLAIVESFQKRYKKRHGNPLVYAADELYLKAGRAFPPLREYGELYQIGNGVGMIPLFLSQARKVKLLDGPKRGRRYLTVTGTAFYPYLKRFVDKLSERGTLSLDVLPVENTFFGRSITVAGLLTGRDVMKSAIDRTSGYDGMLIPDVVLDSEGRFLDDVTLGDLEEAFGIPVRKVSSTPEGLVSALSS